MSDRSEVRVLTKTKPIEFDLVAADNVPKGYRPFHLRGVGDIYAPPEFFAELKGGDWQHPEFPEALRGILRRFEKVFACVLPDTVEEWEDKFRRDTHPWGEIAIWQRYADTME